MKVSYKVGLSEKWLPKAAIYLPPIPIEQDPAYIAAVNRMANELHGALRQTLGQEPSLEGRAIMAVVAGTLVGMAFQMADEYMTKPWKNPRHS